MSNSRQKEIGERIKARRDYLRFSQESVASKIGVSRGQLGHYETGHSEITAIMLERLASVLKCTVNFLYFGTDNDPNSDAPRIQAYIDGMPPDKRDMVEAMIRSAYEEVKRFETTHGRKALTEDEEREQQGE